jgi:choline dehydrogenase-like flavoprotein
LSRNTRQSREVHARAVILCAQSQESLRILLNSATAQYSNGIANSSGVLGHYLTAHVRSGGGSGEFPALGAKPSLGAPVKPLGIYIARFRNLRNAPPYKKFLRGFGYEGESSTEFNWDAPVSAKLTRKLFANLAPASKSRLRRSPSALGQFRRARP